MPPEGLGKEISATDTHRAERIAMVRPVERHKQRAMFALVGPRKP
jgi:hypothetical protein